MIYCPHCDKPLGESHDDKGCNRRMSRRYFFGVIAGAVAAVQASQAHTSKALLYEVIPPGTWVALPGPGIAWEWKVLDGEIMLVKSGRDPIMIRRREWKEVK
jgi:hypothetical protein